MSRIETIFYNSKYKNEFIENKNYFIHFFLICFFVLRTNLLRNTVIDRFLIIIFLV